MRKTGAILFLLIYLVANTELHQFLRLPVLFEHYNEHRQDNPSISLVDFLMLHYFNGDNTDGDYARDQQLPFKSDTCPEISFSIAMPPDDFPETTVQVFNLTPTRVTFKSSFAISSFHFSIWQPPRA
jgi:hypothetical protein